MKVKKTLRQWADRLLGPSPELLKPLPIIRSLPVDGFNEPIEKDLLSTVHKLRDYGMYSWTGEFFRRAVFKMSPLNYQELRFLQAKYGVYGGVGYDNLQDTLLGIKLIADREVPDSEVWLIRAPRLVRTDRPIEEQYQIDHG